MINIFFWLYIIRLCVSIKLNCQNCKYFIRVKTSDSYILNEFYGKCNKFAFLNPITNEKIYKYAVSARLNELDCGKEGKHFLSK